MTDLALDERSPYGIAVRLEHRSDRSIQAYDETTPSSIIHPNRTVVCSGDRLFVGAALHHLFADIAKGPQ